MTGLALAPMCAHAAPADAVAHVGVMFSGTEAGTLDVRDAFETGLREAGLKPGSDVDVQYLYTNGGEGGLPHLADEFVKANVDVIVTTSAPALAAARAATTKIPIVFATLADPVAAGAVTNLARPGGNVTGFTILSPDLVGKRLELLKEAVSGASRIAVLQNSSNPSTKTMWSQIEPRARALGVTVAPFNAEVANDFERAFDEMAGWSAQAVLVLDEATYVVHGDSLAAAASKRSLPMACGYAKMARAGCLLSYGVVLADNFRRTGGYVANILHGAKPGDLPVQNPTRVETVINQKVAAALHLQLPLSLLVRADEQIK
jgi:putative ABC transport system substrate-binding protein